MNTQTTLRHAQLARDRLAAQAHEPVAVRFAVVSDPSGDAIERMLGMSRVGGTMSNIATSPCWLGPPASTNGLWAIQCHHGHETLWHTLTTQAQALGRIVRDSGVMQPLSIGPIALEADHEALFWWMYVISRAEAGDLNIPAKHTRWQYFDDGRNTESVFDLPHIKGMTSPDSSFFIRTAGGPKPITLPTDARLFELPDVVDASLLAAGLLCDQLDQSVARSQDTPTGETHHVSPEQAETRPRITAAKAEPLIRDHLARRPHDGVREVSNSVGCSEGLVCQSAAWKANRRRLHDASVQVREVKELPLKTYLTAQGDSCRTQHHAAKTAQAARDELLDEREAELYQRINEHRRRHPEDEPQKVAKAVGCTARDVELAICRDQQRDDDLGPEPIR